MSPVTLWLRVDLGIAVYLGRRSQQVSASLFFCQAQRFVRTQRTDLEGLDRLFQIVHRAGQGSQVQHGIQRPRNVDVMGYIMFDEHEIIVPGQVSDIVYAAGAQVVHGND
jgi:hypothetical protein